MTRTIARLEVWLRAAAATIVILAFAAGVPWLLVETVGNPIPDRWDWSQPLTNEAILGLIAALAWFFWAQMVLCLIIELVVELRVAAGRSAEWMSQIPGTFGGQQQLARTLMHAVVAIGVGASVAAVPVGTSIGGGEVATAQPFDQITPSTHQAPAAASSGDPSRAHTNPAQSKAHGPPRQSDVRAAATGATTLVEVARGDTLWSLAERHLGSGEQWRTIAGLNEGRLMPDDHRFVQASSIQPGWQLRLPTGGRRTEGDRMRRASEVAIKPGDTLWGLAEEAYGVGTDWPRIYDANAAQLTDPDLILPDQILVVPDGSPKPAGRTQPPEPVPRPENRTPGHGGVPLAPRPLDATSVPDQQRRQVEEPPPADSSTEAVPPSSDHAASEHLAEALAGGGSLLAGGALFVFFAHRRRQFRNRRSGRTIAPTRPELTPVERTLRSTGSSGGASATFLDRALRDLSALLADSGGALPDVAAARLGEDRLDLMLTAPYDDSEPPAPWEAAEDGGRWSLGREAVTTRPSDEHDAPLAPYPALVAIGTADDGATWLLDLESTSLVQLTGDPTISEDLARFIAAELALNVWSNDVDVTLASFASELVGLNPTRVRHQAEPDLSLLAKAVRRVHEASESAGVGVLEGRLSGRGADSWMPKIVVTTAALASPALQWDLEQFGDQLNADPARQSAALVTTADSPLATGTIITLGSDRRFTLTPWNVRLTANQLTAQQARTLSNLLTSNDDADDAPMPPASGRQPIDEVADVAGALRVDLTEPREGSASPNSLLEMPDQHYLNTAATTSGDLAALAPIVPSETRERVLALDPTLDDDLAAWTNPDTTRPRLRLLGPVELVAAGERTAEVNRRCAYFTEIVAYLATREHGATAEQVAAVFRVQTNTIHSRVATIRKWLGADPTTGEDYLPESTLSPAGKRRGIPLYEMVALLSDADLFKRLRVRGQARGAEGVTDLVSALRLVDGRPFDQLRPDGYGWLADTPLDQYLTAAVVDVAHIVATHALSTGDHDLALRASEVAIAAALSEDKPRLDRAAALTAMGRAEEAERYLSTRVYNRSDDDEPPPSPTARTSGLLNPKREIQ